ncbi:MAG: thiamine pyrophosphate-dependent enzyme, partial [Varibaculum cambriense]|nr:thiamine pyrophosphate-dependent enzyme [Varibaculum cambriense]
GTRYRMGAGNPHNEDGELLPVDIAKNAESWGIKVLKVHTIEEFRDAYRQAEKSEQAVMIHIETNLFGPNPPNCSYWDVAVPEVSRIESTQQARKEYEEALVDQRHYWKQ